MISIGPAQALSLPASCHRIPRIVAVYVQDCTTQKTCGQETLQVVVFFVNSKDTAVRAWEKQVRHVPATDARDDVVARQQACLASHFLCLVVSSGSHVVVDPHLQ